MTHRRRLSAIACVGIVLHGPAIAVEARAALRIDRAAGAESCPSEGAFRERMQTSGDDVSSLDRKDIRVRFERTSAGYRSVVTLANGTERSLSADAPSCDGLAAATALALAVALDLDVEAKGTTATTFHTPASAASTSANEVPPSSAAASVRSRTPVAELALGGALVVGLATPVASGMRGGAALLLGGGRWSVGLTALALPTQTVDVGDGSVDVSLLGGGIEGCTRAPIRRTLGAALCARVDALRMHGRANGYARSEAGARPLFTTSLVARGHGRVAGPLALYVEAGAVAPFVRERFAIDTVGVVYDPPIVGGAAGIGALVDFE